MKRGIAWSRPSEKFIIRRAKIKLIRHGSKAIYIRNYLSLSCKLCVTCDFSKSKSHNRTERDSQGVGRDILIFRTMRTTRKQFPVNWLTSGRLAFTIQRAKARRRQRIKKMNKEPAIETAENVYTKGSFTSNGRNRLKRPRDHRFCLNSWEEDK